MDRASRAAVGVAYQRAHDLVDRSGSADRISTGQHKSADVEGDPALGQIDIDMPTLRRPRCRATGYRSGAGPHDIIGRGDADNRLPAEDIAGIGASVLAKGGSAQCESGIRSVICATTIAFKVSYQFMGNEASASRSRDRDDSRTGHCMAVRTRKHWSLLTMRSGRDFTNQPILFRLLRAFPTGDPHRDARLG